MPPQGLHEPGNAAIAESDSGVSGACLKVIASPEPVALVGLPVTAWPQVMESGLVDPRKGASVLATPGELTLVVPWGTAPVARGLFPGLTVDGPFRLLTLDPALDHECLPRVVTALADAGVGPRALRSVERDHVLVPEDDADHAVEVLRAVSTRRAREA